MNRSLLLWMRENEIKDDLIYKRPAIAQMVFFRDQVTSLFLNPKIDHSVYKAASRICSTHRSKSVDLPVYMLELPEMRIIARDNFYNWNVSISSCKPIYFLDYFDVDAGYDYLFCEGMEAFKYGKHADNHRCFSICLRNAHEMYAAMWHVSSQTGKMLKLPETADYLNEKFD